MVRESITKNLALMEEQIVVAYRAKLRRHQEAMQSKLLIEVKEPKTPSTPLEREPQLFNPSSQSKALESNPLTQEKSRPPKIIIPIPDTQVSEKLGQVEKAGIFTSFRKFISRIFSS